VCSLKGDHPFLGRNLLIAYLARVLAEGEEGLCKASEAERVNLINELSIYCYLKIPVDRQINNTHLVKLRDEIVEEKIGLLWQTTLLNSGWNSSPKHSISQGWLFLDQYWDIVAAKHVGLSDELSEAKELFLKELYLAAYSHINSGFIESINSLEKESVFKVSADIDDFIPLAHCLFADVDSVLGDPLRTLQLIREYSYMRISADEAVTLNPDQLFHDVPLRAMRRVISRVQGRSGRASTIPQLRGFYGELYEKHANELLALLGSRWTEETKLCEGTLVVPEFNMTPDKSQKLSPDCLLLSDSHIAYEHKFRELWEPSMDLDDWIWRPLGKPSNKYNPAQLVEFLKLWKSGNAEIVRRYGEWSKHIDFKYLFVFYDAPAWLNSDEFRQYLKRKYPECDRSIMDHVFFTDIRNIEILSGIYSQSPRRGSLPLVTKLIREWANEQAKQGVVTVIDEETVITPDDLIEYLTKRGIYIHDDFKLPLHMQNSFSDCFDKLLKSIGFDATAYEQVE